MGKLWIPPRSSPSSCVGASTDTFSTAIELLRERAGHFEAADWNKGIDSWKGYRLGDIYFSVNYSTPPKRASTTVRV